MRIGDLVRHVDKPKHLYGIIIDWYDSINGLVIVYWNNSSNPTQDSNPTAAKFLEVISEIK